MPVIDGSFEAFVTNLGKYNEGELVGEWVKFPTSAEEMKRMFERIGINEQYEEWFITDYECPISGTYDMLGEYENLDALNYFAARLDEMPEYEKEKFVAIMEGGCDEVSSLKDLINLTYNLDCYDFIEGVCDNDDLGRYYVEDSGIYDTKSMGALANYIDYEQFGRDVAMDESGRFTDNGYIRSTGDNWDDEFDGKRDDIPENYIITVSGDDTQRDGKIKVLVIAPMEEPRLDEIDSDLSTLQGLVGGDIQAVYPYEDQVAIICNEEGKINGMALNRALRTEDGEIYDILAGTFLVAGLTGDNFGSLSDELAEKYTEVFKHPEIFARGEDDKIISIPVASEARRLEDEIETHTFDIYQLKDSQDTAKVRFMNLEYIQKTNFTIDSSKYDLVYSGIMKDGETLESVYEKFNLHHPADFRGHSLSVSDVVAVHDNGVETAYFVDSFGFKTIPDFFTQQSIAVNMETDGLAVDRHFGTWHTIDIADVDGASFYLMEHDTYGDDSPCIIVDGNGKLILNDIYNGFDEHTLDLLHQEMLEVSSLPDPSITIQDMKEYGYSWGGMLPVREEAAKELISSYPIYKLYYDNTEGLCDEPSEIADHAAKTGIFGIEKTDWLAGLERENHLKNAEIATEDDYGMIDGIINNGPKESPVAEKSGKSSIMERLKQDKGSRPAAEKTLPVKENKKDLEL